MKFSLGAVPSHDVRFCPTTLQFATAESTGVARVWTLDNWPEFVMRHALYGHTEAAMCLCFDAAGKILATGGGDATIKLWDVGDGTLIHSLSGHTDGVRSVAFHPDGRLVSGGEDRTLKLWDTVAGRLLRTLEGHTATVCAVSFSAHGALLASADDAGSLWLWDPVSGEPVATIDAASPGASSDTGHIGATVAGQDIPGRQDLEELDEMIDAGIKSGMDPSRLSRLRTLRGEPRRSQPRRGREAPLRARDAALAFHPSLPRLAYASRQPTAKHSIDILDLDAGVLFAQARPSTVTYTSAKIVLVGESGVGKTGLGWRLAHGEFVQHASTHGQQFWLLDDIGTIRADGTQCEAVLWDLAGQPDYRLIHALFVDDADLALLLFDPTRDDDPLHGVEYWVRQLGLRPGLRATTEVTCSAILVAARSDRGTPRLTTEEIESFCGRRGLNAFVVTSALEGTGLEDLLQHMRDAIDWDSKPTTVTTETFKAIKDYVLSLKETSRSGSVILSHDELRMLLEREGVAGEFTGDELVSAVGHLSNHGYVARLRTSKGEARILLAPDLLNNVASSIVLEARRNEKGLGSLEEHRVLSGEYHFRELDGLTESDSEVLLDSAVAMFLDRNVCFRETDPLNARVYLVFPELINVRKPMADDEDAVEDGVAYTATGAVENLYASLVVLLGYTSTFTRTNQWRDHARYVVGDGLLCGFRLEGEREGELDFVLQFAPTVGSPIRTLFQSLFESFLARSNLTIRRYEPVRCRNGHQLNRAVVREKIGKGHAQAFCPDCGDAATLGDEAAPIALTKEQTAELHDERREIAQRSRFEQAVFRLNAYAAADGMVRPRCFLSYAWGVPEHERWVETLANDMVKAGIVIVLDRWENARVGSSVARFVEQIDLCEFVVVVGTPLYREKYDNMEPMRGFVAAAEGDLIGNRMLGTEAAKESVLPVLLAGTPQESLPPLLQGRVYADHRDPGRYYSQFLALALSLYAVPHEHTVVREIRRLLPEYEPAWVGEHE